MKHITITAGHSESDPGAVYAGLTEQSLMTHLRDLVAIKVIAKGPRYKVKTDGKRWQNLPLVHAMTLVAGADVAIELHTNASTNPAATGVEVIADPVNKAKAQRLAAAIARVLVLPLRGDKGWIDQSKSARGRLGFVRMGGMVVEAFFLSNPQDLAKYQERTWMVASAIADELTKD